MQKIEQKYDFFVIFSPFCCEITILLEKKFGGFVFFLYLCRR